MKAAIIHPHRAGLFSLINNVITCALIYDRVYVDWSQGCLYEAPRNYNEDRAGNTWEYLFRRSEPINLAECDVDEIRAYPDQWLTYKHAAKLYDDPQGEWRAKCHDAWQKLGCLHPLREFDGISVLIRAHGHAGEQVTDRSQSLDEYAAAIERAIKPGDLVYVMGDMESIQWLAKRFPVIYAHESNRSAHRGIDRHLTERQTHVDAIQCLREVLTMAGARTMIHPVSNMSTAALYINPKLESVFLR